MRMGAREDQCADVSLLVDDDQRAGAGPLEQPVDVVGPVCQLGPEGDAPSRVCVPSSKNRQIRLSNFDTLMLTASGRAGAVAAGPPAA